MEEAQEVDEPTTTAQTHRPVHNAWPLSLVAVVVAAAAVVVPRTAGKSVAAGRPRERQPVTRLGEVAEEEWPVARPEGGEPLAGLVLARPEPKRRA